MRVRLAVIILALMGLVTAAHANCGLVSGPCVTDSQGNTYRTERNMSGNYTTYQNGRAWSQTEQTLSGTWREKREDGSTSTYSSTPYLNQGLSSGTNRKEKSRWPY